MNLNEKSLNTLELDRVLSLLADAAVSEEAKERALALQPERDAEEVRELLRQTSAACHMVERKGTPGFQGLKPVAASLDRADRGGSLNPAELLRIAGVLRCARGVKAYADAAESSILDPLFFELSPNRYLEDRISSSILSEEEIADSASSTLADIRRHIRAANAKIRDSLQKVINSPTYSKYLQESHHHHPLGPLCGARESGAQKRHPWSGARCLRLRRHLFHRADSGGQRQQRTPGAALQGAEGD